VTSRDEYDIIYVQLINNMESIMAGEKEKKGKVLTSAERSKAYRLRKNKDSISISGGALDRIDELVEFFQLDGRAEVISDLLELPMIRAVEAMVEWKLARERAGIDDSTIVDKSVQEYIDTAKRIMWRALCIEVDETLMKELCAVIKADMGDKEAE